MIVKKIITGINRGLIFRLENIMKHFIIILLLCASFGCQDTRVRIKPKLLPLTKQQQESLKHNKWHYMAIWLKVQYKMKESVEEIAAELAYQEFLGLEKEKE